MPNWCEGNLKVRGRYGDIKSFLKNEIKKIVCEFNKEDGFVEKEIPININEENYYFSVEENTKGNDFYLNGSRRGFLYSPIEIYDIENNDDVISVDLGEFKCAWDLDREVLIKHSKAYNIDFKIYAYEKGMEFNVDFEVHKGEVIKNDEIKFDDYIWECTNPEIGG